MPSKAFGKMIFSSGTLPTQGRSISDQEDHSLKPACANSLQAPISKKTLHKKGLVESLMVKALRSNPSTEKKKLASSSYEEKLNPFISQPHIKHSIRHLLCVTHGIKRNGG
jgi:hypothetical protein